MSASRKRKYLERESKSDHEDEIQQKPKKRKTRARSDRCQSQPLRKSKRLQNQENIRSKSIFSSLPTIDEVFSNNNNNKWNHDSYLFSDLSLYSLLEVFIIGYDICVRDDIWEWLWLWEQRASAFYRILITPVYDHNLFEIRVDSIHGIQCGLLSQFLLIKCSFEYYYSYSRFNIFGGWKFCCNGRVYKHDIYGMIFDNKECIEPPTIWKQIIWFKQLKMELMYKKYGGINMNKMHLTHYYYGHHNFNQIDKLIHNVKRDKFDVYSYNMAQIFDNSWYKNHLINHNSIQLNGDDLSMILGTKEKMRCAQCHQTFHLCRAIKLCHCFKGCFFVNDLYQRHKSMVMDWK